MSKLEQVRAEMVKAMKSGDKPRKDCLSLLLSVLKAKTIDKRADLTEEEENTVVLKEIKQTRETMESCGRADIEEECRFRISVLEEFAPKVMSEEEIRAAIAQVLAQLGVEKPAAKDKGAIMKTLMPMVKGKADGAVVSRLVGELFA
ncbi:MAG: GatB/YqeY domain-containing protein [Oscillospiraceae bacterium]|nr:GatB/YqeY domain-containing protein [Oscillospiraceae bacterium]